MTRTSEITTYLDELLETTATPDFPDAVNGLQLANRGTVQKIAASVDFSTKSVRGAVDQEADFLLVHHGMFWGGIKPVTGPAYERFRLLLEHNVAVYSSHLPLDRHSIFGNNVLLSREFGLCPDSDFAQYKTIAIGVRGEADIETAELADRARRFAASHGGTAVVTDFTPGRRTRRWAMCTGAGASAETLQEASDNGVDTLVVGEGPHWTAVKAEELGLVIIYAGHYATETLGVNALASHLAEKFNLEWNTIQAPTGL